MGHPRALEMPVHFSTVDHYDMLGGASILGQIISINCNLLLFQKITSSSPHNLPKYPDAMFYIVLSRNCPRRRRKEQCPVLVNYLEKDFPLRPGRD